MFMKNLRNYLLVTACKNEADNLPNLIKSVVAQTIRPVVWFIVDDGSTDDTPKIIRDAINKHDWIKVMELDKGKRDLGLHYAYVVTTGFSHAIKHCNEVGIRYEYLGNLDADLILCDSFYENLIKEFEKDPKLGVTSGETRHLIGNRIKYAKLSENEPSGGHMLIRRECFEECGGFQITHSIDSVIKAKANIRGWKTKRFIDNIATEIRDVSAAEGYWKGFMKVGESSYYLNLNPIHIAIRIFRYSLKKPFYGGLAFFIGYFSCIIDNKNQIDDEEIRNYFWNKWKRHL